MSRGLRNNNPGNLRKSNDAWRGLSDDQSKDKAFFQFDEPVYGIRALMIVLKNYQLKYGLYTVREIINRWAPPIENDTKSYVNSVARKVGYEPDETIDVAREMIPLAKAIIYHENGVQPYSDDILQRAYILV